MKDTKIQEGSSHCGMGMERVISSKEMQNIFPELLSRHNLPSINQVLEPVKEINRLLSRASNQSKEFPFFLIELEPFYTGRRGNNSEKRNFEGRGDGTSVQAPRLSKNRNMEKNNSTNKIMTHLDNF